MCFFRLGKSKKDDRLKSAFLSETWGGGEKKRQNEVILVDKKDQQHTKYWIKFVYLVVGLILITFCNSIRKTNRGPALYFFPKVCTFHFLWFFFPFKHYVYF